MRNDKTIVKGKKHLDYVDYAKGIGILLVVLGHTNLIIDEKDKAGMDRFAKEHFGEYAGLAQQYLFYYIRCLDME